MELCTPTHTAHSYALLFQVINCAWEQDYMTSHNYSHTHTHKHTQGILDRLNSMEDVVDVGWLCVDQRPAKQVLSSLASKWKYVYASYLEKQVSQMKTFCI